MKSLVLIWSLLTMSMAQAVPPTSVSGEQQSAVFVQNIKVPNSQATKKAGLDTRIETGNTNLLANPSFEHSTVNSSWGSPSLGTVTAENTIVVDGKQSIRLNSAGGGTRMVQVSTVNAAYLKGQQMVARVKVDTNDTALYVCAVVDNITTGDTNCALAPVTTVDMPFKQIEIPFIAGGTSNGIVIKSATTGSTSTYIDDAFVGTMTPFQGVNGAKLLGTIKMVCASSFSTTSTTLAEFPVQTGCTYTTTGQAQAPSTMLPAIKFATMPAGDYKIEVDGSVGSDTVNRAAYFQIWDGTNTTRETNEVYGSASFVEIPGFSQSISYSTTQSNVQLSVRAYMSAAGTGILSATSIAPLVIKVWYFPPESRIYSQQAYYPSILAQKQTQAITGASDTLVALDTISSNDNSYTLSSNGVTIRRDGVYKITLKSEFNGVNVDSIIFKLDINGTKTSGQTHTAGTNASGDGTMFRDTFYKTLKVNDVLKYYINGTNNRNALANEMVIDLVDPTPTIVGSFAGIEKCANDYECTDTFSATISATGVVSNQNIPWIASTSGTNPMTITYNTNLKDGTSALSSPMNCVATSSARIVNLSANISSSIQINEMTTANAVGIDQPFEIKCQKGANDYKPKTAKVATSIGVPTVPGITTTGTGNAIDTFSVSYGATSTSACTTLSTACAYVDSIGSGVTVTHNGVIGSYLMGFPKTYAKLKCTMNAVAASVSNPSPIRCENCSSVTFITNNTSGSGLDTFGTLYCQGSY